MKSFSLILLAVWALTFSGYAQNKRPNGGPRIQISGKVIDQKDKTPIEYATVSLLAAGESKARFWGVSDATGAFIIEAIPGTYSLKVEFISYQTLVKPQASYTQSMSLGTLALTDNATQLKEVTIKAERPTVEMKLDKRVYNVAQDMTVKGGTASDVLNNVPSVTVDVEGNVSLRGNDNVRILINGRPVNGNSISDVLRQIPSDALDKIEIVTNPSARYDAEGGGGIINILLKQGKNQGLDGSISVFTGNPANHGFNSNINYKSGQFVLSNSLGYSYRLNPGNSQLDTRNYDPNRQLTQSIAERHNNDNLTRNYNYSVGADWLLSKSLTWSNGVNFRRGTGDNPEQVYYTYFMPDGSFDRLRARRNEQQNLSYSVEYTTAWVKNFAREGHKLSFDAAFSSSIDNTSARIEDSELGLQRSLNNQDQNRNFAQLNYVLPLAHNIQFETGYKADYSRQYTQYGVDNWDGNQWQPNLNFTNTVEYKEKVNAAYLQVGQKQGKWNYQAGVRWEDSNIDINLIGTDQFNKKRYHNFFPSALLAYEFEEQHSLSLSYSKRINRPRGRFLNPFSNYSSNISVFQGNPNLNPTLTDAFELTYMRKIGRVSLTTSMYHNRTQNGFQPVRMVKEVLADGTPVLLTTPINLANEYRSGLDVTVNYNPYKWCRLSWNINAFQNETVGQYSYTYFSPTLGQDVTVNQNLGFKTATWFSRVNAKVNLPGNIDWQTNITYNAPQQNAQGTSKGVASANLAFSKDILKDRGTLSLTINDVFNTRKRLMVIDLPSTYTDVAMQWRVRQITLTFTYRFNKVKSEKDKERKPRGGNPDNNEGGDFPG